MLPSLHGFSRECERKRQEDEKNSLRRIVEIALDEKVKLVLMPGDMWNMEQATYSVVKDFFTLLDALKPIPVVILPGNHDYFGAQSPYRPEITDAMGLKWPDHVMIVRTTSFSPLQHPALPEIHFFGKAAADARLSTEHVLEEKIDIPGDDKLSILLHHGTRDDGWLSGLSGKVKITSPFSRQELLEQDFDYIALGHYHSFSEIENDQGVIKAAYAGAPLARDFKSDDQKGVLLFELEKGGVTGDGLRFIPVDPSRYQKLAVDLSGCSDDPEVYQEITKRVEQLNPSKQDLLRLNLVGKYDGGAFWKARTDALTLPCEFEVRTRKLQPGFDLQAETRNLSEGSVAFLFLQELQKKLDNAATKIPADQEELDRIRLAMQMGLKALRRETITISAD